MPPSPDSRRPCATGPRTLVERIALVGLALGATACATGGSGPATDLSVDAPDALMERGRIVFQELADPGCGACHTLRAAGATGTLGPDLDDLKPDEATVVAAVTGGVGVMGAQEHLTAPQVRALATYVSRAAGGSE